VRSILGNFQGSHLITLIREGGTFKWGRHFPLSKWGRHDPLSKWGGLIKRSVTHMMPLHNVMEGNKESSFTEKDDIQQLTPHNLKGEGHSFPTNVRGGDTLLD
jgi:hypothetical protein